MSTVLNCCFFLLPFVFQPEGRYERHSQFCDGMNGADVKWTLDIKPGNTYALSVTQKTNDYLKKPESTYIVGTWKSEGDTLRLYKWAKTQKSFTFYQKDGKLVFQKSILLPEEADLLYLDFLDRVPK